MKLLVDNQLPAAFARWLASRGLDCLHVVDVGLAGSPDGAIWLYACDEDRIVISKDEDFLYRAKAEATKAGLVWVRLGKAPLRGFV